MLRPVPKTWQEQSIEMAHIYLQGGDTPDFIIVPFYAKTFWEAAEVSNFSMTRFIGGMDGNVMLSKTHPGI